MRIQKIRKKTKIIGIDQTIISEQALVNLMNQHIMIIQCHNHLWVR
jgi:hypothetical protein